jgi:hypothetical protein
MKCITHPHNDVTSVCHHCGRPLCTLSRLPIAAAHNSEGPLCGYLIQDTAFAPGPGGLLAEACHCEACLNEFHSQLVYDLQRLKSGL